MLPMDQIRAGGMPPMHVSPYRRIWIVLIIEMVHTILVEKAVGIVHPAVFRRMMINGTVLVHRDFRAGVGENDPAPCRFRIDAGKADILLLCAEMLHIQRYAVVDLVTEGKAYVHNIHLLSAFVDGHGDLIGRFIDGEKHIPAIRTAPASRQKRCGGKKHKSYPHFLSRLQLSRKL